MSDTVFVEGLAEFIQAADAVDKQTSRTVRNTLREAVVPVQEAWTRKMAEKFPGRPVKYGISVRRTGTVTVEERLRRTTGKRPDWGKQQIRFGGDPALAENEGEIVEKLSRAVMVIAETLAH